MKPVLIIGLLWISTWTTFACKYKEICYCIKRQPIPCRISYHTVDCSNMNLNKMPVCEQLKLNMSDIASFNLAHNNIAYIGKSYFKCFINLMKITLDLNPLCVINNETFVGLEKLKELHIREICRTHWSLVIIEKGAFSHFESLEILDIEGTKVIAHQFFKTILCELPQTVQTLNLRKVNHFRQRLFLDKEITECIGKLINLQTLVLDHNFIGVVTASGFLQLKNIQSISLRRNQLLDSSITIMTELSGAFKNLRYLDIGCQSSLKNVCDGSKIKTDNSNHDNTKFQTPKKPTFETRHVKNITIYGLSTLEVLKADHIHSNFGNFGKSNVKVCWKNNNLTVLDFSGNKIDNMYATVLCLDKLKYLSLQGIHAHLMEYTVLHSMPALEYLNLGAALKASNFAAKKASLLFIRSKNLKTLILSDSGLKYLNHSVIDPAVNMKEINLSRNQFEKIDEDMFRNMRNLLYIDLSYNRLSDIPKHVLKHLENVSSFLHQNATLDITNNPLLCACRSIQVLEKLNQSHVQIVNLRNKTLKCTLVNGSSVSILDALTLLEVQCRSEGSAAAVISVSVIYALTLFAISTLTCLYRNRWYVKYTWFFYMNQNDVNFKSCDDKNVMFDAFVSHCYQDEKWVIENLLEVLENGQKPYTLCVHYRNFLAGQFISDNIVAAVKLSRKTILVVTKNFIRSRWCDFELRAAQDHHLNRKSRGIIAIVLPGMDRKLKHGDSVLTAMLDSITYIKWPLEEAGKGLFLLQLRRALGDPVQRDRSEGFQVLPF